MRIDVKRALAIAVLGVLAGCSLTPTYQRPNADLPESWVDAVSYELDLWGANRANVQAAAARVAAREYDMESTRLVLQADVASYYFQTLALKDRLAIAQKNLQAARSLMSLVEVRYDKGAASGLDVAQQRTALLSIEAEVPRRWGAAKPGATRRCEPSRAGRTYLQTVLTSVKEVNDSLSAVSTADQRTMLLTQTVQQPQLALRLATSRYQAGSADLLTVLESQTSQLNAEDSLVQAKLARVNASITLFKALGGGWQAS